jgi:PEP-CTERM motif
MKARQTLAAAAIALMALGVSNANAAVTFAGSWRVDQGPSWTIVPHAYTGQEAAAFLFGGIAADYLISTVDNNPAHINDSAWVSTWGGACGGIDPCGTVVAQDFAVSHGGLYQTYGDTSAYVHDWATGSQYTNYAFLAGTVPEPASWALMILGFGGIGAMLRRSRAAATIDANMA